MLAGTPGRHAPPLRVLLTNVGIANRTGTEIVVLDLALGLARAGHQPMIWAPRVDPAIVQPVVAAGIPVVSRLDDLPAVPDLIHGHHHLETVQALRHFPGVPGLFVCHSSLWWHDAPPRHPRLRRYVAVDEACRERLARMGWLDPARLEVIWNAVDMQRHRPRAPLPQHPRRALIFSNYAGPDTHVEPIQEACRRAGLELALVGSGVGQLSTAPEEILPEHDLVFAKGRCAMEALATGCAVVLCDTTGLGALVTTSNVARFRPWNFGLRLLQRPLEPDAIVGEIQRYDAVDAGEVSAYLRADASLEDAVGRYLALYRSVLDEDAGWDGDGDGDSSPWHPESRPLQREDQAALRLRFVRVPALVQPRQHLLADVALDNRSSVPVATSPPWPCLLTYRWLSRWTGAVVEEDAFRSILQPPSWPQTESVYEMRIIAPSQPGEYLLRATIVQEGWRWLDALAPPLRAEASVWVAAGAGTGDGAPLRVTTGAGAAQPPGRPG